MGLSLFDVFFFFCSLGFLFFPFLSFPSFMPFIVFLPFYTFHVLSSASFHFASFGKRGIGEGWKGVVQLEGCLNDQGLMQAPRCKYRECLRGREGERGGVFGIHAWPSSYDHMV